MNTLIDRDLGFSRTLRELADVQSETVLVGIHSDAPGHDDGSSLAAVAAANEYGVDPTGSRPAIPERSFMRSTMDRGKPTYIGELQDAVEGAVDGRADLRQTVGRLGLRVEGDIKQTITDLRSPPNAPSTIRRKGSSNPLIDTGRMRANIESRREG